MSYYVPVLRWKRAEQKALGMIQRPEREWLTPLVEIVPRDYEAKKNGGVPTAHQVAAKQVDSIVKSWPDRPMYVDCGLLPPHIVAQSAGHPFELLTTLPKGEGLSLIPVARLGMSSNEVSKLRRASKRTAMGVAVRVKPTHFWHADLGTRLQQLITSLGWSASTVDLLLDYEITDPGAPPVSALLKRMGSTGWRTVTAISGAFPKDLSGFSPGEHLHPREDLAWWKSQMLGRKPACAFGDYVIQHPVFAEPPGRANFSASIRYATENDWVVMRGEGVFNDDGPGFAQWPANAQLLCQRPEYCGPGFSYGDRYISDMGKQAVTTGNAETWLRAGLNHHMVYTARQIAKLYGI